MQSFKLTYCIVLHKLLTSNVTANQNRFEFSKIGVMFLETTSLDTDTAFFVDTFVSNNLQ